MIVDVVSQTGMHVVITLGAICLIVAAVFLLLPAESDSRWGRKFELDDYAKNHPENNKNKQL